MAIFVTLVTEPFAQVFAQRVQGASPGGAGLPTARRPLRGLEIKDETYAYIKLIRSDGSEVPLLDSSNATGMSTTDSNFILQQVQDQRMERHQIVETFGDTYLFLFGEAPRFLNVQATLINSNDFNWRAEFLANYDQYLRGTRSIEQSARTYLFYDDNVVEGYILNCTVVDSANDPMNIALQFQFFVTNYSNISIISGDFPTRASAEVPDGIDLTTTLSSDQIRQMLAQNGGPDEGDLDATAYRIAPIRSSISDNTDEYTSQNSADFQDVQNASLTDDQRLSNFRQEPSDVDDLPTSLGQAMSDNGVDPDAAFDPTTMDDLGFGPIFLAGGVGVGAGLGQAGAVATFGASASAGFSVGGFAGVGVGIGAQAQAGFGGFGGAFAGVGVSAGAGAFAGASFGSTATVGTPPTNPYAQQQAQVGGVGGLTSPSFGAAAAYASASSAAQQQQPTPTATALAAAARGGGYVGSGAYLGVGQNMSYVGASYAGQSGSGASVAVGGQTTAFAMTSVSGNLSTSASISVSL